MLLGDFIWCMLHSELTAEQIAKSIEDAISDDGEHIVSVRLNGKFNGESLDLEFSLDDKSEAAMNRIKELHSACKASRWGAGRCVRFAIFALSEEM